MWWALTSAALAGAPWVRAPGASYSKLSTQRFATTGFVGQDGAVQEGSPTVSWATSVYVEVGVLPKVQLAVAAPWVASHSEVAEARFSNHSGGDLLVDLTAGTEVVPGLPVALTARTKWPTYDNGALRAYGAAGQRFPAAGDGQVDAELLGHVGTGLSWGHFRGWWMTETGYRYRSEWWLGDSDPIDRTIGDGLTGRLQLGWTPTRDAKSLGWVFVEADAIKALQASPTTREQLQVSAGLAAALQHGLAIELGASHLVWTAASAPGTAWRAGLSWQRSPPAPDMQPE